VFSFLRAYTGFLRRRSEFIVLALVVATVVFIPVLREMRFETDLDKFLPEDPVIQADRRVEGYFGTTPEPQYLLVSGPNVLSPAALREERNITLQAGYVEGVVETVSLAGMLDEAARWSLDGTNWTRNESRSLLNLSDGELTSLRDLLLTVLDPGLNLSAAGKYLPPSIDPGDLRLLVSSLLPRDFRYGDTGARSTVIVAGLNGSWPSEKRKDASELIFDRAGALRLRETSVRMASTSLLTREVDRATLNDNLPIALGILATVCVILWLAFRHWSYVVLPVACMAMAGVWTFGAAMLLGIRLIAIDIAVIPLILGLGVDYFIHISSRYQEELETERRPGRAMSGALVALFSSMSLAVLTTLAAFLTNVFTGIQPIREFGLLCALGVGSCALLSATFYPAARILLDRRRPDARVRTLRSARAFSTGMALGAGAIRRFPTGVVIVVMVVTFGGMLGALHLRTEFGVEDFVQPDWPAMRTINGLREGFPAASMYQSFILVEGDVATPGALRAVFNMTDGAGRSRHVVRTSVGGEDVPKVQSAATVIRRALELDGALGARFNVSADGPRPACTEADVAGLYDHLGTNATLGGQFSQVVHRGRRYDAAVVRVFNFVRDTAEGRMLYRELAEVAGASGVATGGTILTIRTLDAFSESQVSSTVVAVVFAALFLVAVYRRPALGLLSILPVALSAVWVMGTMYVLDISLNALTLTVTALTIGLGIDYTIYITQRFRQELAQSPPGPAMRNTVVNMGAPIFLSALTTWAGFGVLAFSPMPLTQQFGILSAATIGFSFLLGVFVFPIFLLALEGWTGKGPGARPSQRRGGDESE
jgi:predicted RND superfamily exporter protein